MHGVTMKAIRYFVKYWKYSLNIKKTALSFVETQQNAACYNCTTLCYVTRTANNNVMTLDKIKTAIKHWQNLSRVHFVVEKKKKKLQNTCPEMFSFQGIPLRHLANSI